LTDEEKNIFGNQLRERRNELNLTTQKVALDAEVGESTYKRLEAGDGNPRLDTLVKIVKCLKTDLNSVVPQEHLCKDAGIWQIVRKLLSMDKKKMNKAIKAILAMLDAMSDD
jgi:transcriptional regulator with XRE-family HTH domain